VYLISAADSTHISKVAGQSLHFAVVERAIWKKKPRFSAFRALSRYQPGLISDFFTGHSG
jgi:hypothetical protein